MQTLKDNLTLTRAPFDGTSGMSSSSKKCTSFKSFGEPSEILRFFTPPCVVILNAKFVRNKINLIKNLKNLAKNSVPQCSRKTHHKDYHDPVNFNNQRVSPRRKQTKKFFENPMIRFGKKRIKLISAVL